MFFLKNLVSELEKDKNLDICIYLYEGFVSFKDEPTDHKKDCERLLKVIDEIIKSDDASRNIGEGSRLSILDLLKLDLLKLDNYAEDDSKGSPLIIFADAPP